MFKEGQQQNRYSMFHKYHSSGRYLTKTKLRENRLKPFHIPMVVFLSFSLRQVKRGRKKLNYQNLLFAHFYFNLECRASICTYVYSLSGRTRFAIESGRRASANATSRSILSTNISSSFTLLDNQSSRTNDDHSTTFN